MNPGRELDALVAEKVLGYRLVGDGQMEIPPTRGLRPIPSYSEDVAAAWEVVEKLKELAPPTANPEIEITAWRGHVRVDLLGFGYDFPVIEEMADTAPHAICLAALKAVETEAERR